MRKILTILGAILFVVMLNIACGGASQSNKNTDSSTIDSEKEISNAMDDEGARSEIDEEAPGENQEIDEASETEQEPLKDGSQTVTAKFVGASAFEGQATFTFKKGDGTKILFCRNYMNPSEPELKFNFIGEDAVSANMELVGQVFEIKYKINKTGQENLQTGDPEPCNQIISVVKK